MTFLDPPSAPDVEGWNFLEWVKGYFAQITLSQEKTMKLTFAPGETGYDSGLRAFAPGIQQLSYEVYFSGTGGENIMLPGGKKIPIANLRLSGWNQVSVGSRFVVNGVDVGVGNPTDISCYIVSGAAPSYVRLDYFSVEGASISGNGATDLANVTGILPVSHGGTGVTTKTGDGSVVLNTAPVLKNVVLDTVQGDVQVTGNISAQYLTANLVQAPGANLQLASGILPLNKGGTGTTARTGTGNVVFDISPSLTNVTVSGSLVAEYLSGNGAGVVGVSAANLTGVLPVSQGGTGVTTSTGSGSVVLNTSPVFRGTTYVSNITGNGFGLSDINMANVAGVLPPERGGTGTSTKTGTGSLVLSNSPTLSGQVVLNGTLVANTLQGMIDGVYISNVIQNGVLPPSLVVTENVRANGYFLGNGALLTGVATTNASSLTSGTLSNSLLPANVSVSSIRANGFPLTSVNAANLVGTVSTERLPSNVVVERVVANAFGMTSVNAANLVGTIDTARLPSAVQVGNVVANGYGLTSVNAANLVGIVSPTNLPDTVVFENVGGDAAALSNIPAGNLVGTVSTERLPSNVVVERVVANAFGMTSVNAANLVGTIDTTRLPTTVQVGNVVANGYGLTSVNAANLVGIVSPTNLPDTVVFENVGGDAAALSNIPAGNLVGTVSTERLPSNVVVERVVANAFGMTSVNAANLVGTIDTARLPSTVQVGNVVANGYGLTNVNAANLTGIVSPTNLPDTVVFENVGGDAAALSNIPAGNLVGTMSTDVLPANISVEGVESQFYFGNGAYLSGITGSASDASALIQGTLDNARLPASISVTSIQANGYALTSLNGANIVGQVSNSVFTEDIEIANTVHASYYRGNGIYLEGVATANAVSLVEGTLDNARLPASISVTSIQANGYALTSLNGANIVGQVSNSVFTDDIEIANTVHASYFTGNGSLLEGVATINAATLSEGTLSNDRLPLTIDVDLVQANLVGNGAGIDHLMSANLVGTLPAAVIPASLNVDSVTAQTMTVDMLTGNLVGNGYGLFDVYAGNITGLDLLTGNASLLTTGEISQSVLPQSLGNADTMLFGNGVAISNTNAGNLSGAFNLDMTFAPGSIDANVLTGTIDPSLIPSFLPGLLKSTFVSNVQALSTLEVVANNIVTATTESTRVYLNGLKLASIDSNTTDYTVSYIQDLSNTTTTFTVDFTNPIGYGDVLDVLIETNTSVNANGDGDYYNTVYANTLQVNDIYFAGNSVISNADIELVLASGVWTGLDGTAVYPSFTFESANTTGLFLDGSANLGITSNGVWVASFGDSGVNVSGDITANSVQLGNLLVTEAFLQNILSRLDVLES